MTESSFINSYGIAQKIGNGSGMDAHNNSREHIQFGEEFQAVIPFIVVDGDVQPAFNVDADEDGTRDSFGVSVVPLPAGAVVESAKVVVTTAFTGLAAQTVDLGCFEKDGTEVDADGLAAALDSGDLASAGIVAGAGALVGTKLAEESYIKATPSAALTGVDGVAKLIVTYFK